jgi:hypothetical protein
MRCSNCGNELPDGVRFCTKCGTPAAPSAPFAQPPAPAARPTDSFAAPQPTVSFGAQSPQAFAGGGMVQPRKKSGCAKALVVLLAIALVLLGLAGAGGYYAYRVLGDKLRSSEAYTVAVSALKNDPNAADKIGAVTDTGFPLGAFHEEAGGTGDAAYHLSVKGTKANGTYDVVMTRRAGKWYLVTGKLTLAGGEVINVRSNAPMYGDPVNANVNAAPPPPPAPPGRGAGKRR